MAENSSTSPRLAMRKTSPPTRRRTLNRLRKPFSNENKSTPSLLGLKIKRFSEFENYSRGTLGGFSPLADMGSPDIDSLCLEKQKNPEKECVLTQLTKKIGLGVYVRGRNIATERDVQDYHVDIDGDERETWYMFYPPPPSPSLAQEPKDWSSGSSPEAESVSSSPQSVLNDVLEAEVEGKGLPRLSAVTQGSQYGISNPTSPVKASDHHESNNDIDISALILSAETLAAQYQDLLLTPSTTPRLTTFHPDSENDIITPFPFPSQLPSPLSLHPPPSRPQTPKTLRKIKRHHSLRKLIDYPQSDRRPLPLPSPTSPTTTTSSTSITNIDPQQVVTLHLPNTPLLTPPPSATKLTTPIAPPHSPPPVAIRSPDFLSTTFTSESLHPTRLSLAAHPNRSPTPSQGTGAAKAKKKKARREFVDGKPPQPPPRESSRGRSRGGRREREKEKEERTKASKLGVEEGDVRRETAAGEREDGWEKGRGDARAARKRHEVSEIPKNAGGDVNEGGEGWL